METAKPKGSPCKTCDSHPCDKPQKCDRRWEYVKSLTDDVQGVDMDHNYSISWRN